MRLPEQCHDGDVLLVLDDGTTFCAHSQYLRLASAVLRDALACSVPAAADPASPDDLAASPAAKQRRGYHKLPLPGSSKEQVLLLLHCIYAWERDAWVCSLNAPQLVELATISDKLRAEAVLKTCDTRLVKICEGLRYHWTKYEGLVHGRNAHAVFCMARKLQLTCFLEEVGKYMGSNPGLIRTNLMDAGTAAIMRGAAETIEGLSQRIQEAEQQGFGQGDDF